MDKSYEGNISLLSGGLNMPPKNQPKQYKDRQTQYFADVTSTFSAENAFLASDYFEAEIQGLNQEDPTLYEPYKIRMTDVTTPNISSSTLVDDYKNFLIASRSVNYVPRGAKFKVMGSTWICTNPKNISSPVAEGLIQRCNATWNSYDYYGNLMKEPIIIENMTASATTNINKPEVLIMNGYFRILCQYNELTKELDQNSRIILGTKAFHISGYSAVAAEFTDEDESVRLLSFSAKIEEPNLVIDDMANRVAGGNQFSWEIVIT